MKIAWTDGTWQNAPPRAEASEAELIVTTADQSDFWNRTGYGFVHNNGHALLRDFPANSAMEVEFSPRSGRTSSIRQDCLSTQTTPTG
jgi:regulation of enolase protein 1 (concanavalin A-like superfamily)